MSLPIPTILVASVVSVGRQMGFDLLSFLIVSVLVGMAHGLIICGAMVFSAARRVGNDTSATTSAAGSTTSVTGNTTSAAVHTPSAAGHTTSVAGQRASVAGGCITLQARAASILLESQRSQSMSKHSDESHMVQALPGACTEQIGASGSTSSLQETLVASRPHEAGAVSIAAISSRASQPRLGWCEIPHTLGVLPVDDVDAIANTGRGTAAGLAARRYGQSLTTAQKVADGGPDGVRIGAAGISSEEAPDDICGGGFHGASPVACTVSTNYTDELGEDVTFRSNTTSMSSSSVQIVEGAVGVQEVASNATFD